MRRGGEPRGPSPEPWASALTHPPSQELSDSLVQSGYLHLEAKDKGINRTNSLIKW